MIEEFMSTHAEVHSFVIGMAYGLSPVKGFDNIPMDNEDVKKEPHYFYGGYVLGEILEKILIIAIAITGVAYLR